MRPTMKSKRGYCHCNAVWWGGRGASIQGVKKRAVWIGSFLLERMRKERIEGWYQGTMESIEIKSKRNIRRKRYQKRLQLKKEMMPTLGFSYGRFFFKKEALCSVILI